MPIIHPGSGLPCFTASTLSVVTRFITGLICVSYDCLTFRSSRMILINVMYDPNLYGSLAALICQLINQNSGKKISKSQVHDSAVIFDHQTHGPTCNGTVFASFPEKSILLDMKGIGEIFSSQKHLFSSRIDRYDFIDFVFCVYKKS